MAQPELIDTLCERFISLQKTYAWFIIKYFGPKKMIELIDLARDKEQSKLFSALNDIWFKLPDNRFNIIENPKGWSEFLSLVEI